MYNIAQMDLRLKKEAIKILCAPTSMYSQSNDMIDIDTQLENYECNKICKESISEIDINPYVRQQLKTNNKQIAFRK